MARITLVAVLVLTALLFTAPVRGMPGMNPYFALISEMEWQQALSYGQIEPMDATSWSSYMNQWDMYLAEGEPYPPNTFVPATPPYGELYAWGGGGGGGIADPEGAGLVMTWGPLPSPTPSYSSAWVYNYPLDPDLSNATITTTVLAPQFDMFGNQVNIVSMGIQDVAGAIRSWSWFVGPGGPIPWNVPTQVTINTAILGLPAATPMASGFANNPLFNITQSQLLVVDENAQWVGGPNPIPPPGQQIPRMWNYWQNTMVTPNIPGKPPTPTKWSQPPEMIEQHEPPLFRGWDEVSLYSQPPIVADDWPCTDRRPVTDIHWWGSFIGWDQPYPPPLPSKFHIGIWTDVPADPTGTSPSHPGKLIWENYCSTYEWNFAGYDVDPRGIMPWETCFQFNQKLEPEQWFYQDPGPNERNIYWLSIAAIYCDCNADFTGDGVVDLADFAIFQSCYGQPPVGTCKQADLNCDGQINALDVAIFQCQLQAGWPDPSCCGGTQVQYPWGWKTRPHFFQDDAYRIFSVDNAWPPKLGSSCLEGTPIEWQGESWDLAFELTTIEVEEPRNDLGDAPDSTNNSGAAMTAYPLGGPPGVQANFPTVFGAGSPPYGPIHLQPTLVAWLGPGVSLENEADIGIDQDGNNNIVPPADGPDLDLLDDAVVVPLTLPQCRPTTFNYTVNVATPVNQLYVNAWFDWNRDGDWDDTMTCAGVAAPEWAVQNQILAALPAGLNNVTTPQFLPWHPPGTPNVPPIWMRITLSEQPWTPTSGLPGDGGSGPVSGYQIGETEDYYFTPVVPEPQLDFGDAPDRPYPTLLASNGARHTIVPGFFLGASVDAEPNGQPNLAATGDDANGVPDDEDGVVFLWPFIPGLFTRVDVTASAAGWLNGWIDYNGNGSWADPGEQVFSAQPLIAGVNQLRILVPRRGVRPGRTYARLRLTSVMAVPFDGTADDGEVEDYLVTIRPPAEMKMEFSVDIGSDAELSDPFPTGNEVFDPGDVYWWKGPLLPQGGKDGFKDDLTIFGADPYPDPPDPAIPHKSAVPVGQGGPEQYMKYFDLDGVDEVDVDLVGMLPPGDPISQPIARFLSNCIHEPFFVQISYDDDTALGWPGNDVPVTAASPVGQTYGKSANRDEVIGLNLGGGPAPLAIKRIFPLADEVRVHQNMQRNPDVSEQQDDDVDALDVVWSPDACPVWLFSSDREANKGLDPGDIYQATAGGPTPVVDGQMHLGLPQGTDVDAFEFAFLAHPLMSGEYLVVLFSVDDDDPLTPNLNESGGLLPNMIYYSYLNGAHAPLLTRPLDDDVDAISISPKCLGDRIGLAKQLPVGSVVALGEKVVTGDLMNREEFGMFYIEEEDRSSGIGVAPMMDPVPDADVGDCVCVIGTTVLNQGTELIFQAEEMTIDGETEFLVAPGMMNRSTGGAAFGEQPGLCDDVLSSPRKWSYSMNNVGSLVRTFGKVTSVKPTAPGLFWINDGSDLRDGTYIASAVPNVGICVLPPPLGIIPAIGSFVSVTGEMLAVPGGPSGSICPVRLLVPRDAADIQVLAP